MATESQLQIVPGTTWTAINTGLHIQAHGAGFLEVDGVFYLIGEDKINGTFFQQINAYSSGDLVRWKLEGPLLIVSKDNKEGDLGARRIVERPKVIYNEQTATYVMYVHIDNEDYTDARVGVATCKTVAGGYEYRGSFRPLGYESRDIGLFQDDDGAAYLLTEDRKNGLRIASLTADYLGVAAEVYIWAECIESPAVWKKNDYYYVFGSHLTGWDCNDNVYSYASSMSGPWSLWKKFADPGSNTYESQSSAILPLNEETALYWGDRWCPSNLAQSTYVFLPLEKRGHEIYMQNRGSWVLDAATKSWEETPPGTVAPSQGRERDFSCHLRSSTAGLTTLRIRYRNPSAKSQQVAVEVNGKRQTVDFLPTGARKQGVQEEGESVLHCALVSGDNSVVIQDAKTGMDILGVGFVNLARS